MKISTKLLVAVLATTPAVWPISCAADQPVPRSESVQLLRELEDQLSLVLAKVDVDAISKIWADDFVSTMADGRVTTGIRRLATLRAEGKAAPGNSMSSRNEQVDVRIFGDWAVILVTSRWYEGDKSVGSPYQATHVWAKRKNRWRLVTAHISEVRPE